MGWTPFPLPADQHRQVLNAARPLATSRHIDGLFAAVGIQARYDLDGSVTDIDAGTVDHRAIVLLEVCEPHVDPDVAPFGPHVQNSTAVDRHGELRWNVPTGSAWSSQNTATRSRARTVHTGARSSVAAPVLRRLEHCGLAVPSSGCGWAITHAGLDTWLEYATPDRARTIA